MAHQTYENFVLANEIEDQYNSHLDLMRFCTVDNSLVGTPGMKKKINVYTATNGTEKLGMGEGNSKSIEVSYAEKEYEILMAQNRFDYYDEQEMTDPMVVTTGMRHMATDMFNTVNADIFGEFEKASRTIDASTFNFDAFADAKALLKLPENQEVEVFGWVSRKAKAIVRKALKDDLKYIEAFSRTGYIGTVCGINLYDKEDAKDNEICIGTKAAVTAFNKRGVEVGQEREEDTRKNSVWSRKYYLVALTDDTKAAKITLGA